jgi:hypothetical protein
MNLKQLICALIALVLSLPFCSLVEADETDLVWSTFLGGSGNDHGRSLVLDLSGNPVVVGYTRSSDFPTTPGAYDQTHNGGYSDVFVARFSASGDSLLWSTFLGGSGGEDGTALVLDYSGNPVVVGATGSTKFPTTPGAYDQTHNGSWDVFAAKLSASGDSLLWSTFLGGSEGDYGRSVVLDLSGNPVVTGFTESPDFPTTPGAYDQGHNGAYDVFVARLSASGDSLLGSTFLGGSDYEDGHSLVLDLSGNPVVTGYTYCSDFPTTPGAYDQTHNGGLSDVFVASLSASGDSLLWSTFLGGSDTDAGNSLVLDLSGNPVVVGDTHSSGFPTTPGAYDQTHGGGGLSDVFVASLSASGDSLLWSTFLGGSDSDGGRSLVLDLSGHPVVTGFTESPEFPTTPGAYDQGHNGDRDVFVARFSASADSLLGSTFLGGSDWDDGYSLVLDLSGHPVVVGETQSSDFPTTPGAYDQGHNGYSDVFVTKFETRTEVELEEHVIGMPETFELSQNYPNPFNLNTEIRYHIPEDGHVALKVFNILGQEVRTLVHTAQEAGEYVVNWDGQDNSGREVASGLYFCWLEVGDFHKTIKMVLVK